MKEVFIKRLEKAVSEEQVNRMLFVTDYNPSEGFDFETGQSKPTAHRTSSTFFDMNGEFNDIREHVLEVLKDEFGHIYNTDQCEPFQLQKYGPNQFFKPHWDFFNVPGHELTTDNDRVATVIVYLKTAEKGGTTNFPNLNINMACEVGDIVYFTYDNDEVKTKTLHEGVAIEEGEKIIATLWIREKTWS